MFVAVTPLCTIYSSPPSMQVIGSKQLWLLKVDKSRGNFPKRCQILFVDRDSDFPVSGTSLMKPLQHQVTIFRELEILPHIFMKAIYSLEFLCLRQRHVSHGDDYVRRKIIQLNKCLNESRQSPPCSSLSYANEINQSKRLLKGYNSKTAFPLQIWLLI